MLRDGNHGAIMRNTWSNFVYLMARKHKEWAGLCMTNDLRFSGQAAPLKCCTISEKPYPGVNPLTQVPLEDIQDANYCTGDSCYSLRTQCHRPYAVLYKYLWQALSALLAKTELTLFSPRVRPSWTIEDEFGDIRENGASRAETTLRTGKSSRPMLLWAPSCADSLWFSDH